MLKEIEKATVTVPRPFLTASKVSIPKRAKPGSVSANLAEKYKKSSYGLAILGSILCEQNFVFASGKDIKFKLSERAKLGIQTHTELLNPKPFSQRQTKASKTSHPWGDSKYTVWSSPEEEAAYLFLLVPSAINKLLRDKHCTEFPVFGHEFDRAFAGSIDRIESKYDGKTHTFRLHELKSLTTSHLPSHKRHHALIQVSLYQHFLKQMLNKKGSFSFRPYFEARGLDATLPFKESFSAKIAKQLSRVYPIVDPPKNLRELGAQWAHYVQTLPPIKFDPYIYIITSTLGRLSLARGYGHQTKIKVEALPHDEDRALQEADVAMSLLDGRKQPSGVPASFKHLCLQCPFSQRCKWRPDLHLLSGLDLGNQLTRHVETITKADFSTDKTAFSFNDIVTPDLRTKYADRVPKRPQTRRPPSILGGTRKVNKARLALAIDQIKNAHRAASRQRTTLTQQLTDLKQGHSHVSAMQRIKMAKKMLSEKRKAHNKAKLEAQKIQAVHTAAQRRAYYILRNRLKEGLYSQKGSTAIVPYVQPEQSAFKVALFQPSISRVRMQRRKAHHSLSKIPRGGQAIPEDATYSMSKLQKPPKPSQNWTYQFDSSFPSTEEQAALALRQEENQANDFVRLTDAEAELSDRETKRALRRAARQKDSDAFQNNDTLSVS